MKENNIIKELKIDKIMNLEYLEKELNEAKINYYKNGDTIEIYIDKEEINIKYEKVPSNYFKNEIKITDISNKKISQALPIKNI